MIRMVAVSELKTHCLRLVEEVARQRREIVVTKRGKPIARVVPIDQPSAEADARARLHGTLIGGEKLSDFETRATWEAARG